MKTTKRGQLGVEFFLIVAFILVLGAALSASTDAEVVNMRSLDRAALAKSASDAVAHAVNLVLIQGNGASVTRELFFPAETPCLQYSAEREALFCEVPGAGKVYSAAILAQPQILSYCYSNGTAGWKLVTVRGTDVGAQVNCTRVS